MFLNSSADESYNIQNNYYILKDNSVVRIYDVNLGGKVVAPHHLAIISGKGADFKVNSLFFATGTSVIDMEYIMRIKGMESSGKISGNGAVIENSRVVFRGTVDIKKGAKNAKGEEQSRTTLLSKKAKAHAVPCLLVDENEVTASHAASIGTIEETKIFYLMSRGLSRNEALSIILQGTFEPLVEEIREIFGNSLSKKIGDVINERTANLF